MSEDCNTVEDQMTNIWCKFSYGDLSSYNDKVGELFTVSNAMDSNGRDSYFEGLVLHMYSRSCVLNNDGPRLSDILDDIYEYNKRLFSDIGLLELISENPYYAMDLNSMGVEMAVSHNSTLLEESLDVGGELDCIEFFNFIVEILHEYELPINISIPNDVSRSGYIETVLEHLGFNTSISKRGVKIEVDPLGVIPMFLILGNGLIVTGIDKYEFKTSLYLEDLRYRRYLR